VHTSSSHSFFPALVWREPSAIQVSIFGPLTKVILFLTRAILSPNFKEHTDSSTCWASDAITTTDVHDLPPNADCKSLVNVEESSKDKTGEETHTNASDCPTPVTPLLPFVFRASNKNFRTSQINEKNCCCLIVFPTFQCQCSLTKRRERDERAFSK
jgi:hypothetical protein